MAEKKGVSLGWRIGLIVVLGTLALGGLVASYSAYKYQKLAMQEFQERIVTLGENIAQLAFQPLYNLQNDKKVKIADVKRQVKSIVEASATRKDIVYVIVTQNGAQIASSGTLPEGARKSDISINGKTSYETKAGGKRVHEIEIPIEMNSQDMLLFLSAEIGKVNLGFDEEAIIKKIASTRQQIMLIALAGSLLIGLGVLVYIYGHVVAPIKKVAEISRKIGNGEVGEKIKIQKSNDEIGLLTRSFSDMADYITLVAALSEKISQGDLSARIAPKSERDMLGTSFARMLVYINEIASVLNAISRGELTNCHMAKSESDVLGRACSEMTGSLNSLVSNIKKQSDYLANTSKQLNEISQQSQQTISQLAETIANISAATSESATNSQNAADSSKKAEQSAKAGGQKMGDLLVNIKGLSEENSVTISSMQKMATHSEDIRNMMAIIKAVADETKLLSFNAAIEAARAGESGRGFAVVAEEIRKLSDMSTEQASRINEKIKNIIKDISLAIDTVNRESQLMQESSRLTEETNDLFLDIIKSVDDTAARMESIAASSEEISASSQEASASSQEQAASMEELNAMVNELEGNSRILKESTDKFKI